MADLSKTQTKKVSGLKISREGYKFTASWSRDTEAGDHDAMVYIKTAAGSGNGWSKVDINGSAEGTVKDLGANTSQYTYTINPNNYWPLNPTGKHLYAVRISIRQRWKTNKQKQIKYSNSEWADKSYDIKTPGNPKYVAPAMYNSLPDRFTYSWDQNNTDDHMIFTRFRVQTVLMDPGVSPDWSLVSSQTITKYNTSDPTTRLDNQPSEWVTNDTGVIIAETQETLNANRVRYLRVCAQGIEGESGWTESYHAFGASVQAEVNSDVAGYSVDSNNGTVTGGISFQIADGPRETDGVPDTAELQYAITNPSISTDFYPYTGGSGEGALHPTISLPNNFNSWETERSFSPTKNQDLMTFNCPRKPNEDECLFVRLNTKKDGFTTYGVPTFLWQSNMSSGKAADLYLTPPRLVSVEANPTTHKVTVQIENNTNLVNNKSFVAVYYRTLSDQTIRGPYGIIPYGTTSATITLPEWKADDILSIGIKTMVAGWEPAQESGQPVVKLDTPISYTIYSPLMESRGIVWEDTAVPLPPSNISVRKDGSGTAFISWQNNWADSTGAEISWSEDKRAWDSTNEPSTYTVENIDASHRYITGLSAGEWYFKVRLLRKVDNNITIYGSYSDLIGPLNMSEAPDIPTLIVDDSDDVFTVDEEVTVRWGFSSNDGTSQGFAELAEATKQNNTWTYTQLRNAVVTTATKFSFRPKDYNWVDGSTHFISVRVKSDQGVLSDGWSNPIAINVAKKPVINITGIGTTISDTTPLHPKRIDISNPGEDPDYITTLSLCKLPLTFSVAGAGNGGRTLVVIRRAEDFDLDRPDESKDKGFDGETIVSYEMNNISDTAAISIGLSDIIGHLDDRCSYEMIVSVIDSYGQSVSANPIVFRVNWDLQAFIPTAVVNIDTENEIATIRPIAKRTGQGDVCDIYRLSADRPQLIGEGLAYGVTYVDPYPTLGRFGGYRIVCRTKFGDYTTAETHLAWTDYTSYAADDANVIDIFDKFAVIIDFDGGTVEMPGNVSVSNSWSKDFQTTRYLGGSIEGDWNPGVERIGSVNVVVPIETEPETMHMIRLLADTPGIVHVRTPDGSNFYANADVKDDREEKWVPRLGKVSIDLKRVDAIDNDIMTYEEWSRQQE